MRLRSFIPALLVLAACRPGSGEDPNAFAWTEPVAPGTTLHVRTTIGSVTVRQADGAEARVMATRRWRRARRDELTFAVERDGSNVYICAMWPQSGSCRQYRARTSSGRRFNPLALGTWFGRRGTHEASFTVDVPAGVRLDASTVSGSVTGAAATAGLVANTVNGAIRFDNARGPTYARTVNGSVRVAIDSAGPADSIVLRTVNGAVRADLPPNIEGRLTVSTVNGSVSSDVPITYTGRSPRNVTTQLGASERVIRLETVNGSITIRRREP